MSSSTRLPITVYTLTFNEARQIRAVLESVREWADEMIVIDSASTDGTVEIARELGATVLDVPFEGFGKLRNAALDAARNDWIFSLDSDERCTDELSSELAQMMREGPKFDAYLVPRKSHFLGRWMRHCGWYPDFRQPQFFNRKKMRYADQLVHETYELNGTLGCVSGHALQYPWATIEVASAKLQRYSTLMAERYHAAGKRAHAGKLLLSPLGMFLKVLVLKNGWRDGWHGFVLAGLYAYYTFLKYAKLWEKSLNKPIA